MAACKVDVKAKCLSSIRIRSKRPPGDGRTHERRAGAPGEAVASRSPVSVRPSASTRRQPCPSLTHILIHAPEPGYNRFKVARDIQNACNTSGVARELIRVIEDAAHDPQCGRGRLAHDPAVVAVIDKLRP